MTIPNTVSPGESIITVIVLMNTIVISEAYTPGNNNLYWALLLSLPVLFIALRGRRENRRKAVKKLLPTESPIIPG